MAISSEKEKKAALSEDLDAVTRKWGLEVGILKALSAKPEAAPQTPPSEDAAPSPSEGAQLPPAPAAEKGSAAQAKELLAKYGAAYLATSITLAAISFSFFYALVDRGVDVAALLQQFGIEVDGTGQTVGTVALAYAAHKAASPIRFPPTVLLTPIVANFFGKRDGTKGDQ